jgi:hypothetical protein
MGSEGAFITSQPNKCFFSRNKKLAKEINMLLMDNNVVYYVIIIVEVIFVELAISLSGGINKRLNKVSL